MSKSNYFGKPFYRLIVAAFTLMCLGLVHAANQTDGMSELQRKLYVAVLNQPNEVWAENQPFMEEFKKTNGSEASLLQVKQKYSYAYATEQMTIAKARIIIPELAGLTDATAFEVIHSVFYPTLDRAYLAQQLNYTLESKSFKSKTSSSAFANTGTIVFWILLVLGVGGYFKMKSDEEKLAHAAHKDGSQAKIDGWLRVFIVCLGILAPAINLAIMQSSLFEMEKAHPALLYDPEWTHFKNAEWLTLAIFSAFLIYTALQLRFSRKPKSLATAKIALISAPFVALLVGIAIPGATLGKSLQVYFPDLAGTFIGSIVSGIIWWIYLRKSKLVGAIYAGGNKGASPWGKTTMPVMVDKDNSTLYQSKASRTAEVQPDHHLPAKVQRVEPDDDRFYAEIAQELASKEYDKGVWLKAMVESGGEDVNKQTVIYTKLRLDKFRSNALEGEGLGAKSAEVNSNSIATDHSDSSNSLAAPELNSVLISHLEADAFAEQAKLEYRYGIVKAGTQFRYKEFLYDKLADAVAYAERQQVGLRRSE